MNNYLHIFNDEFGNRVFRYHFPSITALVEYLKTAPVNYKTFPKLASKIPDNPKSSMRRGESLEDTLDHLIYGYGDTYSEYRKKSQIDRIHIETPMDYSRVRAVRSYVGSRVDIEAYINGLEKNMLRLVRSVPKNIITFNYDLGCKCFEAENQIINRGMIAMFIIKALEQNNFSVNLNSFILHKSKNFTNDNGDKKKHIAYEEGKIEVLYVSLNLKDADLPLNEAKCIGPFMRLEFQRRAILRLIETTPNLSRDWSLTYGHLLSEKERGLVIKNSPGDITFGNSIEMGIKGEDLEEDLESVIKYLHLDDIITLKKRLH